MGTTSSSQSGSKDPAATAVNYLFFVGAMAFVIIMIILTFTSRVYVRVAGERSLITQVQCTPLEGIKATTPFVKKLRNMISTACPKRIQDEDIMEYINSASEDP